MALTQIEKDKYSKFVAAFPKERLIKFSDKLKKDYVFLSQMKNTVTSDEAKKHFTKEKTDAEDMLDIIESYIRKISCI